MYCKRILAVICGGSLFGALAWAGTVKLSNNDKKFLNMAADANMTQAHIGEMAEKAAAKTSVRDFGQQLVRDHTQAYGELAALAGRIGATIPKGIDVRRDSAIRKLTRVKGRTFDRQFLRDEVLDHERALTAFRREAAHGSDADVRAFASKMIPTLREHLHTAESLERSGRHIG